MVWMQMPKDNRRMLFESDGATRDGIQVELDCVVWNAGKDICTQLRNALVHGQPVDELLSARIHTVYRISLDEAICMVEDMLLDSSIGATPEIAEDIDPETIFSLTDIIFGNPHGDQRVRRTMPNDFYFVASPSKSRAMALSVYVS